MINANIRFTVNDDVREKLREVLASLLGATQAMSGCISCRLYLENNDSGSVLLLEEWKSIEDLTRHIASSNYRRVLEAMELSNVAPEIKIYEVFDTKGFEFIESIRVKN